jgi:hypothetical protein
MRRLGFVAVPVLLAIAAFGAEARGETSDGFEALSAELDQLVSRGAATSAGQEVQQARELLRLASQARSAGHAETAHAILAVLPLQLRLIRELMLASEAEDAASAAETRLLERERERDVEHARLETILERLLALTVVWDDAR